MLIINYYNNAKEQSRNRKCPSSGEVESPQKGEQISCEKIGNRQHQKVSVAERSKKKRRSENRTERRTVTITLESVKGHQYSELVIRLSTLLYAQTGCGLRSVVSILKVINDVFNGILGQLPCYNTIENWVKKIGLDVYNTSGQSLKGMDYAEIIDESMMIGSEKLLVTLAVPSAHQGRPLCHDDVSVLDISVSTSWAGKGVKKQLKKAAKKAGCPPQYVISDNASIMNKGIRLSGIQHHRDISHSLGMYLERTYKKAIDFQVYIKAMTGVKFKYNMTKTAYLLPPTQRTVARFINLADWVKWSRKMLDAYPRFSPEEKQIFSFIPTNAPLIDELSTVVHCVESIESVCKHQGFSKETSLQCQQLIEEELIAGNSRMIQLGNNILDFLQTEEAVLESEDAVHNNSSDIIESVFGMYKARKSPNKLYGVTPFILFIPAQAQLLKSGKAKPTLIKERLERVKLKDIDKWKKKNLSPNLVSKRTKLLKKIG